MVVSQRALADEQRIEHIYISMLNTWLIQANEKNVGCTDVSRVMVSLPAGHSPKATAGRTMARDTAFCLTR